MDQRDATKLRLFIALPIPESVKDEIERVQSELRKILLPKSVRLTRRDQFHLTLKFLGAVESNRVTELTEALRGACSGFPALKLRAERIGCFPSLRYPRVVWVWVHDDAGQLGVLQGRVEAACGRFAEEKSDKKFTGHVTLARIDGVKRPQAESLAKLAHSMTERRFGKWTATEVNLMRSELFQSGAVHTVLEAFPLA